MTAPSNGDEQRRRDDVWLTRREAEVLVASREAATEEAKEAHRREHDAERDALQAALGVENRERIQHDKTHEREHELHMEKHGAEGKAVETALAAVARERTIHAEAHEREHVSHGRIHDMSQLAVGKAESSVEERLKAMNEFRGQLRDQQATLASRDALDVLRTEMDRRFTELNATMLQHFSSAEKLTQDRYETNRSSITALEKTDLEAKGKGIGQGAMVAYILTGLTVVGSILAILIVLSNLMTGAP